MTAESPSIYCDCTPIAETECGASAVAYSDALLKLLAETLATATGQPLEELPPLYDIVDLDAVDQLFDRRRGREGREPAVVTFTYLQWNIFIRSDGRIRVCDSTATTDVAPVFDKPMR